MPNNFKISRVDDGVKFQVKVQPNASKCEIAGIMDDAVKIRLDVPPIEGKANEKCVKFLSKLLDVPKTSISIISGDKSRSKLIFVKGNPAELENKILNLIFNV